MNDVSKFLLCSFYEVALIIIAHLLKRFSIIGREYSRKIVHIFTSFLIFPIMIIFKKNIYKIAGPLIFLIVNFVFVFVSHRKGKRRALGIVLYPLSVLILVLFSIYGSVRARSVIVSVLIMGLSDGSAAIVGKTFGRLKYKVFNKIEKSVEGTITFFVVTFILFLIFYREKYLYFLLLSILLTIIENISPRGFDNLSVPLVSCFLTEVVCHL